ncbi:unknown [Faecalibacterium sp. CAG:74]|nr:unknown [Faecalibacterium sp. CAG:74]
MKQLPLPAHPVFPSRLDSIAALPELLRSRQIGCVLVIGDAHAVDCESLLLPVLEDSQIMYAVHAAVSLSDSKDGALTRTDVDTALQAFTDKQAQAILAVGGNDAMALGQALLARLHTKGHAETFEQWRAIPLILLPAAADASAVFAPPSPRRRMLPPYSQKQVTCSTRCAENHAAFRFGRIPAAMC